MCNNEEWRDIQGYGGLYQVSNFGRVKSYKQRKIGKILKPFKDTSGYYQVRLSDGINEKLHLCHRLVALAFPEVCGEYFQGAEVNHLDENKTNNYAINLVWCTSKENSNYGTRTRRIVEKHKIQIGQYTTDGKLIKKYSSIVEARKLFGSSHSYINDCLKGRYKTAYGFKWKYLS